MELRLGFEDLLEELTSEEHHTSRDLLAPESRSTDLIPSVSKAE